MRAFNDSQIGLNKTNSILDTNRRRTQDSGRTRRRPCQRPPIPCPTATARTSSPPTPSCTACSRCTCRPTCCAHMQPHFERLGALAGGRLDELAHTADRNPPTLEHRTRTGIDEQQVLKHPAYVEMERLALSRIRPGRDVAPRGDAGLEGQDAAAGQVRADLPLRAGGVRPVLPGLDDRLAGPHAQEVRQPRTGRALPAALPVAGLRHPGAGRDVHDRAGGRLRHRRHADARLAGRGRAAGACPATSGSAPIPTPTSRWCWRAPTARRPA